MKPQTRNIFDQRCGHLVVQVQDVCPVCGQPYWPEQVQVCGDKVVSNRCGHTVGTLVSMNNSDLWIALQTETGKDRHVCKLVIYSMIFGMSNIVCAARENGLEVEDLVAIRMAFDNFIHRERKANATTQS